MGSGAFLRCASLSSVDLSNARSLGFKAFGNCVGITQISFGGGLEEIGGYALYGLSFYGWGSKLPATPEALRGHSFAGGGAALSLVY